MRIIRGSFYVFMLFLLGSLNLSAQDEEKTEESLPDTPEIKAFLDAKSAVDQLNKEIEAIFAKAKNLTRNDVEEIQKLQAEFNEKYKKQSSQIVTLQKTAVAALKSAPKSSTIGKVVLDLAIGEIQNDQYPAAYDMLSTLMKNENPVVGINDAAVMAAFGMNDFVAAKKHLAAVIENKEPQRLSGRFTAEDLDKHIANWKVEAAVRAAEAASNDLPRVKMETSEGDIVIELFENEAPQAVGNFVSLVEKKYYDGLIFHRVLPGFMAQGGCPDGRGTGGPGYNIYCECQKDGYRKHFAGTLSMAHAGKDTGGSQFFLTFLPTPHLDGRHTAFGRVIEGMDVLSSLKRVNPQRPSGVEPSKIKKATVIRKRNHPYAPTKVE